MLTTAKTPLFKFGANIRKLKFHIQKRRKFAYFLIEKVRKFRTVSIEFHKIVFSILYDS